jgi:hypothetical protein
MLRLPFRRSAWIPFVLAAAPSLAAADLAGLPQPPVAPAAQAPHGFPTMRGDHWSIPEPLVSVRLGALELPFQHNGEGFWSFTIPMDAPLGLAQLVIQCAGRATVEWVTVEEFEVDLDEVE